MTEEIFLGNIKGPKGDKGEYASVDTELSSSSTNPVQNKKITEAINNLQDILNNINYETVEMTIIYEDETEEILNIMVENND